MEPIEPVLSQDVYGKYGDGVSETVEVYKQCVGVCVLVRMMHMLAYVVKDSVGGHVQVGTIALLPRLEGVGLWAGKGMFAV